MSHTVAAALRHDLDSVMSEPRKSESSIYRTPFPGPVQTKSSSSVTKRSPRADSSPPLTTPIMKPKQRSSIERQLTTDPTRKVSFPVLIQPDAVTNVSSKTGTQETIADADPFGLLSRRKEDVSSQQLRTELGPDGKRRKVKKVKSYYNRQNALIDAYLGSTTEEEDEVADQVKNGPKIQIAIYGSFVTNFCLFIIQLYAAISTGSLALFATAADAFMDLVSSIVMLITAHLAATPSKKFPVGRKRVETVGIILFCALMTTVSIELIIESGRNLGKGKPESDGHLDVIPLVCVGVAIVAKSTMFVYCFLLRRYPVCAIFMLDHRNDIIVNSFGLLCSIVATKFDVVWFLDSVGAISIALLILTSWVSTAFEHMWLLVGKTAPQEFLNKLVYVSVTHDERIHKIETVRAYTAGEKYYVEVDIIMDADLSLRITHDVGQTLQRKLEGLADVERAFVHVDYDAEHDIMEEHKRLYEEKEEKGPLTERLKTRFSRKKGGEEVVAQDLRITEIREGVAK